MAIFSFLILTSLCIADREAFSISECGAYARRPEYTDITVDIYHIYHRPGNSNRPGFLHGIQHKPTDPQPLLGPERETPVGVTSLPRVHQGQEYLLTSPTSRVNISGAVRSFDPTPGTITYNAELKYYYSCAYPLEYLINNTQVGVSSSSIALKDNNGSFISTLSMALFQNINYTTPRLLHLQHLRAGGCIQPDITERTFHMYFVLLDRCYASVNLQPSNSTIFNPFVSYSIDQLTSMLENGDSQKTRFYFPGFRFIEQQNETISTYYLHCITRLCERSTFKQCNRKRRSVQSTVVQEGITEPSVITVAIKAKTKNSIQSKEEALSGGWSEGNDASVGLGIAVALLVVLGVATIVMAESFYRQLKRLS
ncbi:hypothetical protein CesoFtcFv8_006367 [Champsocephalus esox]|uniref:ZP-C domain-containing protein n=1 Tax=Champsocephalus esox TaxID=159716 RepID=A0AAN8CLX7_9TELE|nr:hypothetical protein CesoFtcFv8_006367 [Champsocephalus esox]